MARRGLLFVWLAAVVAILASIAPTAGRAAGVSDGRCAALSASPLPSAKFDDGPTIAPGALQADFDAWMAGLRNTHPDLSIRTDLKGFARQAARIRAGLTRPMSRREAWLRFATLNPYFHDAHAGILMPDYRDALEAHLKAGGRVVPLDIRFARDGSMRVFATAPGEEALTPGDQVLSINGRSAPKMVSAMMARSIGDTPRSEQAWLERRFAMLFWYLYGDTGDYDLVVQPASGGCPQRIRAPGGASLPVALQSRPAAKDLFEWRILPGDIGYLRVDGFDSGLKDDFDRLTQAAFAAFKAQKVQALIIDVRENGGGDDPLWEQDLVDHFTTKPYVQLSHYVTRVTKDNAGPGDVIGAVQSADYDKRFTPPADDPIRFGGPVYILGGPNSYSATIQFMVAAQDFGLAKIAGEETAALSCSTGQVKHIDLPWMGLSPATPIIAYTRPSGRGCKRGLLPDVPIVIDEVRPDETLKALMAAIIAARRGGTAHAVKGD